MKGEKLIGFMADAKLQREIKVICASNNIKIKDFMTQAVRDALKKYKQGA